LLVDQLTPKNRKNGIRRHSRKGQVALEKRKTDRPFLKKK